MSPLTAVKIVYFLLLVSFAFVCCHIYSDPLSTNKRESCATNDKACKSRDFHDVIDEGPTFIGRDGLTRLDGVKVRSFN